MKTLLASIAIMLGSLLPLSAGNHDADLIMLDRAIDRADIYTAARKSAIDSIKRARYATPLDRSIAIARSYADFDIDSAIVYATAAADMATDTHNARRAALLKAGIYNSSLMMYKEACDLWAASRPADSDTALLADYYTLGVQLFKNLEEMAPDAQLTARYSATKRAMRDSVLSITGSSPLILANRLIDQGHLAEALDVLLPMTEQEEFSPANGAAYHVIAGIYGRQDNTTRQIHYLALAALADIENGVREYIALPQLALLLYERGDIDRAYRYMLRSIDDATACNARIRLLDMSTAMSVISSAYGAAQKSAKIRITISLIAICVLLVICAMSLVYARRRNKMLHLARMRQDDVCRRLTAESLVKEKYVNRFMNLSLDYLNKMDRYRKDLFKIASRRNFDALYDAINSTRYIDIEAESFYRNFDEAFLELYPGFVEWFNSMLRPDQQVSLRDGERFNTELRIFALMRLGITESADIARFLHCSQSTVYNYRTRYRSRAIDRDKFVATFYPDMPKTPV